jgi:transposase
MHHVRIDCHISALDVAVVNEVGRLVKASSVATGVNNFMEFVKKVTPLRIIYLEEGTLAAWVLEVCVRFGEKLVITNPKENHWISSSCQKNDPLDALKLAQLARGGYIKGIHHPVCQRRRFIELRNVVSLCYVISAITLYLTGRRGFKKRSNDI